MTAAEWIAKRRAALGLLSAYATLRGMSGDLTAAVAVASLGIRGSDITAAEDDARESLPRALDALEAVLDLAREWEGSSDLLNPSLRPYTRSGRLRAAIETALRSDS